MKKNILFLGITIVGFFASCSNSFLDEDPKADLAASTFYKTVDDIQLAVNAVVNECLSGNVIGDKNTNGVSMGDDIMTTHPASNKQKYRDMDQFYVSTSNGQILNVWKEVYSVVYQANAVMENYEQAEGDETEIETLVSVARFYRALNYFEAVRIWGEIPLIKSTVVDLAITRGSVQEVYDFIISDLTEAIKWLPSTQKIKSYPTIWAAKTLLADVYLTMAGWPLKQTEKYTMAASLLKDVKDNSGAGLLDNYWDLFEYMVDGSNEDHKEVIFNFVQAHSNDVGKNSWMMGNGIPYVDDKFSGYTDQILEVGFLMRFPDDDRKEATFTLMDGPRLKPADTPWQEFNAHHPTLRKFRDGWDIEGESKSDSGKDFMYYRFADVLLMYAEAAVMSEGSPSTEAYDAINAIRRRAHGVDLTPGLDQIAFRDSVIEEVAWEFAGEHRRWFDLVRTEKVEWANDLSRKYVGEYTDSSGNTYTIEDLKPLRTITKDYYLMPIPDSEIVLNPNLGQNTGY